MNSLIELIPGCKVSRPFKVQNGLRFTDLSAELLEEVSTTAPTKEVHEESLFDKALGSLGKNIKFTEQKGFRASVPDRPT